jgi:hypothetical protein
VTSSTITVTIGSNSPVTTTATGDVEVVNPPCPGSSCSVGLGLNLQIANFVSGDLTFENTTLLGSGQPPGVSISASGSGSFLPGTFHSTIRATVKSGALSGVDARYVPNYAPLNVQVNWLARTLSFSIDQTIPAHASAPAVRIQMQVSAAFVNSPPYNVQAGGDQTVECTSPAGTSVTLSATASDLDSAPISYDWIRGTGGDGVALVGYPSATRTVTAPLGTTTYAAIAYDPWLVSATDGVSVTVRDTVAPTLTTPSFDFGCGSDRPRDIFGALCALHAQGTSPPVVDTCDSAPVLLPQTVTVYNSLGQATQTVQCGPSGTTYPLASTDTAARFEIRWSARDSSNNQTPVFATRVIITAETPSVQCSGATRHYAHVQYNGLLSTAPTMAVQAVALADFASLTPGSYSFSTPWVFSRPSVATVQTGISSIQTSGIGNNVARIGDDGQGHFGLVVEEQRTNLVANARNLNGSDWYAGWMTSTTTMAGAGPDGVNSAADVTVSASGYSKYQYFGTLSGSFVASSWYARASGSGPFQLFNEETPSIGSAVAGTAVTGWQRAFVEHAFPSAGSTAYVVPLDGRNLTAFGGVASQAMSALVDLVQFEAGKFPTEAILTSGGVATRASDRLAASSISLLDGGRLNLELRIQPKGKRTDYSGWLDLWSQGADYISVFAPAGTIYVSVGGSTQTFSGIDWARGDTLDIFVGVGGSQSTVAAWRNNNGAATRFDGASIFAISGSGNAWLLCSDGAYTFSAWVQQIRAWKSATLPAWIP